MSIQSSELVWRKSAVIDNTGTTNGGVMSFTASSVSNVKNNIFPDVPQSERTAGSTLRRKMFIHVNNGEANGNNVGLTFVAPRVFVETKTPGDDTVNFFVATQTDVESTVTGTEQKYGMGELDVEETSGSGTIVVNVEDWSNVPIFANGMKIRVSDKADINASGNEEYHVINGVPSAVGNQVTLTLTGTLANTYAAGSKVSSVYEPGDIDCAVSGFANNGSGTFTSAGITTNNLGTVQQAYVLTFDTATAYTVRTSPGNVVVGSGNVGSDFSPTNSDTGSAFFSLLSSEFGGTFVASETIDFTTSPSAIPIWYERIIPAGAASLSSNSVIVAVDGESA